MRCPNEIFCPLAALCDMAADLLARYAETLYGPAAVRNVWLQQAGQHLGTAERLIREASLSDLSLDGEHRLSLLRSAREEYGLFRLALQTAAAEEPWLQNPLCRWQKDVDTVEDCLSDVAGRLQRLLSDR